MRKQVWFWKGRAREFNSAGSIIWLVASGFVFALLVEVIVRLATLKRLRLDVPLCASHQLYFFKRRLAFLGILLAVPLIWGGFLIWRLDDLRREPGHEGSDFVFWAVMLFVVIVSLGLWGMILNLIFCQAGVCPLDVRDTSVRLRGVADEFAYAMKEAEEKLQQAIADPDNPFAFHRSFGE